MNNAQKEAIITLFSGGSIYVTRYGIRLRNEKHEAVRKLTQPSFDGLRKLIKKENGVWVINRIAFRGKDKTGTVKLHGKSWAKQYYKQLLKKQKYV